MTSIPPQSVHDHVREGYSRIARSSDAARAGSCCGSGSAPVSAQHVAAAVGYSQQDLNALPQGANMGLSCGNPTAIASLKPGETVLDLGSGGGFDCFIAGPKVGATGRIIGVDMTADMLSKARRNLDEYRRTSGLDNVEFRLGEIENLPLADSSIDVVISNCVLNLSPDKPRVWREIARVLKPGGRVAVSDLALLQPLPEIVRHSVQALVGCIAGAVDVQATQQMIEDAGLIALALKMQAGYIDSLEEFQDPLYRRIMESLPPNTKVGDYITSLDIAARKPGGRAPAVCCDPECCN